MNCLIWILLLCCCGSNGGNGNGGCNNNCGCSNNCGCNNNGGCSNNCGCNNNCDCNNGCGCNRDCGNTRPIGGRCDRDCDGPSRHHHADNCPCKEPRVEKDCYQVKRDTCDIPPYPTLSRGETCGCETCE